MPDCLIGITRRYTAFWLSPAGYAQPSGTGQAPTQQLVVVANWIEELKAKVGIRK